MYYNRVIPTRKGKSVMLNTKKKEELESLLTESYEDKTHEEVIEEVIRLQKLCIELLLADEGK